MKEYLVAIFAGVSILTLAAAAVLAFCLATTQGDLETVTADLAKTKATLASVQASRAAISTSLANERARAVAAARLAGELNT